MNTKKLIFVSGLVVVALLAIGLVVPLAFAQGPVDNLNPVVGPQMDSQFGPGLQQNGISPMMGGRGQGMMGQRGQGMGTGPGFVDTNNDGVCDNFVDNNGDGVCDNMGSGQGAGFVDNDGDGVCDHAAAGGQQQGHGPRRGGMSQMGGGRWSQQQ